MKNEKVKLLKTFELLESDGAERMYFTRFILVWISIA